MPPDLQLRDIMASELKPFNICALGLICDLIGGGARALPQYVNFADEDRGFMPTASTQTVAERIVAGLKRHEVEVLFGQSLPSALILAAERNGIPQLAYRQENAGGAMADGYARVSGRVGIVTAQNGPAATLLVPPLSEAMKASTPVIALVQEVERAQVDKNAFQELNHFDLFKSCAKWVKALPSADRVDDYLDAAFIAATSGRPGPAVLLLPADLLKEAAPAAGHARTMSYGRWPLDRPQPAASAVASAAGAIAEAAAPVVVCGGGVLLSQASKAVSDLQERAHLPVFTTFMGKGSVVESHPLSCGVLGALVGPRSLGRHSRAILEEADVILLIGTRTNQNGTDSWRLIPDTTRLIHIDMDPGEIGRNYEAMRLVGDAAETATALCSALEKHDLSRRIAARPRLEKRIAAMWASFEDDRKNVFTSDRSPIRPERVMAALQSVLDDQTIVVADASYSSMWILGQLRTRSVGTRFVAPRGLAGLGWGLPLAIGAKTGAPGKSVVVVVGDGGFAHSWAELETLVRHSIAVTVIVLNNGVLGFQKDAETVKFGAYTSACHFAPVDHAAIARACGCEAERVVDAANFPAALGRARAAQRPYLIEVMTDPDARPPLSLFASMPDRDPLP
jgi:acetolactate synthase-1/2/3 large subunit